MFPIVDVHCHVTAPDFPQVPHDGARGYWPCMRCGSPGEATVMIGDKAFRKLDARSWDATRRIEDMERDGIALQVLSPMPELLSYWMTADDADIICDTSNHHLAEMIAGSPRRFRGLGAVPLQVPERAAAALGRLKRTFGLSGVEIGSNINGIMLGDPRFDVFWEAAQAEDMAVFVHALHPVASKPIAASPQFTAFALFPVDVAMTAASLILADVPARFPRLRIGFSHGGGALGSILGRLDQGRRMAADRAIPQPSEQAKTLFFDSNVYDPDYLGFIIRTAFPGRVFAGTDYPYEIMQRDPAKFIRDLDATPGEIESLSIGAASLFLNEDLAGILT
jgi:aminocarboxymuconate-semialdehyde decarboxylase